MRILSLFCLLCVTVFTATAQDTPMKNHQIADDHVIYTSKSVLESNALISVIFHDAEGDWQFYSAADKALSEDDARVIPFKSLLERDKTLADMPQLPKNHLAVRESIDGTWKTSEIK